MIGNLIGWIFFGLIAGAIAKLLTPDNKPLGCLATIGVGVLGSFLMGGIFHVLFAESNEGIQPSGLIGSVIGGVIVLLIFKKMGSR